VLSTNYSNNLQDATAAYKLLLTQPGQVAGLPPSHLASLAQQARAPPVSNQNRQHRGRQTVRFITLLVRNPACFDHAAKPDLVTAVCRRGPGGVAGMTTQHVAPRADQVVASFKALMPMTDFCPTHMGFGHICRGFPSSVCVGVCRRARAQARPTPQRRRDHGSSP